MTDLLLRRVPIGPQTFNADAQTFDAVISTGAPVTRRDARGPFVERLDLSAVDVPALVGTVVLDGHRQAGSEHAVGVIISARREANAIVATVQLSRAADVVNVATKIAEGVLAGVSIGYAAERRTKSSEGGVRTIVIRPRIHELSIVAVPADPLALIRKDPTTMATENTNPEPANDDTAVEYRQQVRAIARAAGQSAEWADTQIDSETDIVAVRAAAFEAMTTRRSPTIRTQTTQPANDDPAVILERRTGALFARVNGGAPDEASRAYFNDSLVDHARALVMSQGGTVAGMDREQILRMAMHTTSDFPNLLTGVGNRTMLPAYEAAQSPLKVLGRPALMNDFRTATRLKLGEIGKLQKVTEAGEIKSTTRGEAAESYKLDTYGSIFALSRKAFINDDLGAFRDWGIAAGRAAAETEAGLLFDLLTQSSGAGPVMTEDGKRMFHADHGNLAATGTTLDIDTVSAGRTVMRRAKGLDGKTPVNAAPRYIMVGPEREREAEIVLAQIADVKKNMGREIIGNLELLVEPRLSGVSWYLFADPASLPVLEYAYLSSAQGPQIASREGWEVLGMEFRVTLDFGAGGIDFRGAYRNPGA